MSAYNREQSEAMRMVQTQLRLMPSFERKALQKRIEGYLDFRKDVEQFLERYFSGVCTEKCYQDHYSACCNREGIVTFFADVVINLLMSEEEEIAALLRVLDLPYTDSKCVYLGEEGCLWRIKPIICEMFLCEPARTAVFEREPKGLEEWERLKKREKGYTWPSRPVLFDELEAWFMKKGCSSSLMYFHNSPGLLRVKALGSNRRQRGTST
jgi:hypothetical protein